MGDTRIGAERTNSCFTRCFVLHVLTRTEDWIIVFVVVVAVGQHHEVISLVVDQAVVALGKRVVGDAQTVEDAFVVTVHHQRRYRQVHRLVLVVVDDEVDVILDVALCDEARCVDVVEVGR